jgi:hypothetical protein
MADDEPTKATFEVLMKLAECDRQRMASRSSLTGQMLIVIWAAQGVVIIQADKISWMVQFIFALVTLGGGVYWIIYQWSEYEKAAKSLDEFAASARRLRGLRIPETPRPDGLHPVNWMQFGVTLLLSIGIALRLTPWGIPTP